MSQSNSVGLIDLQIMWNRLIAVVEEQAQTLMRTAFSPIVRECGDLSAGVFDLEGRMLAQAVTGTPGHVNSMAESVKHFLRYFPVETMKAGDAYITNDPWMGTGHLNDFVITTPCFRNGKLVALFSCTSHLMDIGGIGFGPDATDVFMEGLYIPMLKLFDQGKVNETLMSMIRANTRLPVDTEGDVYSLAGCNDVGARRLVEMMDEFGIDSLDQLGDHIIARSREAVLAEIAKLPKGTWHNEMMIDGYDEPLTLKATLTISDGGIHVDYSGTSPASGRGINVPHAYTTAYTVFGLGCVVATHIPNNAGSLEPLTVSAPDNTILNAPKPNAVASRHIIGQMLPDVTFGCLRQVVPDRVPAEGTSCLWNINVRGHVKGGEGGEALGAELLSLLDKKGAEFRPLYPTHLPIKEKIDIIVKQIYGGEGADYSPEADRAITYLESIGLGNTPICMAKTQYSLTDDATKLGRPRGFRINVNEVRASAGAGFVVAQCGDIMTMPGLPKEPAAERMARLPSGEIVGLF